MDELCLEVCFETLREPIDPVAQGKFMRSTLILTSCYAILQSTVMPSRKTQI
jgi:hypothetical protein